MRGKYPGIDFSLLDQVDRMNRQLEPLRSALAEQARMWEAMHSPIQQLARDIAERQQLLNDALVLPSQQLAPQIQEFARQLNSPALRVASTFDAMTSQTLLRLDDHLLRNAGLTQVLDLTNSLAHTYQQLFQSLEESLLIDVPSYVTEFPPLEVHYHAEVVAGVWSEEEEPEDEGTDTNSLRLQLAEETEEKLISVLEERNPAFLQMWRGAREARLSDNPDRVRHFVVSQRELTMHLLHTLAPDERVKEWSEEPEDFHNDRPTRGARLRFIYRAIDRGPFRSFVKKDVRAHLEVLEILQQGTHKLNHDFAEEHLDALQRRVDNLILFLLSISGH